MSDRVRERSASEKVLVMLYGHAPRLLSLSIDRDSARKQNPTPFKKIFFGKLGSAHRRIVWALLGRANKGMIKELINVSPIQA